jgi:hypothetical protein
LAFDGLLVEVMLIFNNFGCSVASVFRFRNTTRILWVYLSPDGKFTTQRQVLKKKADNYAHRIRSPRLTPQDIHTFHRNTYGPSMGSVLTAISVDEEELGDVQTNILAAILNKLGPFQQTPNRNPTMAECGGLNPQAYSSWSLHGTWFQHSGRL